MTSSRKDGPRAAPRDVWALEALKRANMLTQADAERMARDAPEWVASAVVDRGLASAGAVRTALAGAAFVKVADLGLVEPGAVRLLPEALARKHIALPTGATDRFIRVATANPLDVDAERAIAFATSRTVEFSYALPSEIDEKLEEVHRPELLDERLVEGLPAPAIVDTPARKADTAREEKRRSTAARLADTIIADAAREGAQELHLLHSPGVTTVIYSVDGVLRDVMRVPPASVEVVRRRFEMLGATGSGDAVARVDGRPWRLDVSVQDGEHGAARTIVRLVDPQAPAPTLDALGLLPETLKRFEALLSHRTGLVVVAGPKGNGRYTTLYAAVEHLSSDLIAATVEDRILYKMTRASQHRTGTRGEPTFGAALREALGRRPQVLLLKELADAETAAAAVKLAPGRLVLAAVDAPDAAGVITHLAGLGVTKEAAASVLKGIAVQRLLRLLCRRCARGDSVSSLRPDDRPPDGLGRPVSIRRASGCIHCRFTGYSGRTAAQQNLLVDGEVADLIRRTADARRLDEAARRQGSRLLRENALRRVWSGETSVDEFERSLEGVLLPRLSGREEAVEMPASAPDAAEAPLALIADDDPAMRHLAGTLLREDGLATAEAEDGRAALEEALRLRPAILLLDMDMPELNGFQVLESLRGNLSGRSIPVMVITVQDDPETQRRCMALGAEDFIAKPIRPAALVARVRAVLRRVEGG